MSYEAIERIKEISLDEGVQRRLKQGSEVKVRECYISVLSAAMTGGKPEWGIYMTGEGLVLRAQGEVEERLDYEASEREWKDFIRRGDWDCDLERIAKGVEIRTERMVAGKRYPATLQPGGKIEWSKEGEPDKGCKR